MTKKILFGLGTLGFAIAMVPMFAAFEAHVINVTATIENALSVPVEPIQFGTVFPQEHLEKNLVVSLSNSFMAADRVDDVEYIIRQKPKCAWSWKDNVDVWHIDESTTRTGHPVGGPLEETIDCGQAPRPSEGVPPIASWGSLPVLCNYVSKDGEKIDPDSDVNKDGVSSADGVLTSFHKAWTWNNPLGLNWLDTKGRLAKSDRDFQDNWIIDLAVPCFGGHCAQDWLKFVRDESGNQNMTQAEADSYIQPIENEHKVFGCDLWVEVTGVSKKP